MKVFRVCNLLDWRTRLEEAECFDNLISVYERNDQDFEGDPKHLSHKDLVPDVFVDAFSQTQTVESLVNGHDRIDNLKNSQKANPWVHKHFNDFQM